MATYRQYQESHSYGEHANFILYHGKATGKNKAGERIWTRIGVAWSDKSGKGFNITWEYLPLHDGVTVMLPYDQRHDGYQLVWDELAA